MTIRVELDVGKPITLQTEQNRYYPKAPIFVDKPTYVRPNIRGKGVGAALLERALEWSHQPGYERVFVEHETANFYGGKFWSRYFNPYLYSSMRYIDVTLDIQG